MPMQEEPIVGAQYEDADGLTFEVTVLDVDEGTIGIRHHDGSVGEIDIDTWYELELRQCKADGDAEDDEATEDRPDRPDEEDDEDDYNDEEEQ
ncbi:MAG: DUF6763 family protein [Pseudomonadota bacterium]